MEMGEVEIFVVEEDGGRLEKELEGCRSLEKVGETWWKRKGNLWWKEKKLKKIEKGKENKISQNNHTNNSQYKTNTGSKSKNTIEKLNTQLSTYSGNGVLHVEQDL